MYLISQLAYRRVCVCVSEQQPEGWGCTGAFSVRAGYINHEKEIQLIPLHNLEVSQVSEDAFASESSVLFKL